MLRITKLSLLSLAIVCLGGGVLGCGEKADYSGTNELAKSQEKPKPVATPNGAQPESHKGMMIPIIPRK